MSPLMMPQDALSGVSYFLYARKFIAFIFIVHENKIGLRKPRTKNENLREKSNSTPRLSY